MSLKTIGEISAEPEFAVLFDMDGVLIDSVGLNWQAYNTVLSEYGIHINDEQLSKYVGRTLVAQVAMINEDFGVEIEAGQFEDKVKPLREELFEHIQPKAGVVKLLRELETHGVPSVVATSTPRTTMESRLKTAGIFEYFAGFVTEDEVTKHKPDPEVFLQAAEKSGIPKEKCIVIEDAPSGLQAAKTGGFKCVAVLTPYVQDEQMAAADAKVMSLEELDYEALAQLAKT